jgi:hypothetical protein
LDALQHVIDALSNLWIANAELLGARIADQILADYRVVLRKIDSVLIEELLECFPI